MQRFATLTARHNRHHDVQGLFQIRLDSFVSMLMQNERLKVVSPHSFSGWIVRSRVRREWRGRNYTIGLTEISKINSCKLLEQEDMIAERSNQIR
jgi:hypothetical protein